MKKKNTTQKSVTVFAPASVANLGSGFDVFGLAIKGPGDEVTLTKNKGLGLRITSIKGDGGKLSCVPIENTAGVALLAFFKTIDKMPDVDVQITKKMPLGSGMGSSAASAVAAVFAANVLYGKPISKRALVTIAMEGERVASGTAHADNIAPSMLGGITLVRGGEKVEVLSLPVPSKLRVVVLHPNVHLSTADSRAALPKMLPLKTGITQWTNTASLVVGLYENDLNLVGRSMADVVAEPARKPLIPCYDEAKNAALKAGAKGCSISGAGPSVVALCEGPVTAVKVATAMLAVYSKNKIKAKAYVSAIDKKGARLLK
jgi:homoserine kinase